MNKKIFIQLFLFLIVFFICFYAYKNFFNNTKIKETTKPIINKYKDPISPSEKNIITKLNYSVRDLNDNEYVVLASYGEFDEKRSGLILMTNVNGTITIKNKEPIVINATKALYDELNHNTKFFGGVIVNYMNHEIVSDKLNLSFDKKIAILSDNIIYKNMNTKLQADRIDIDLISKESKIYMNEKSDKVKIKSLN